MNKKNIEYCISDCFKEICRLQELESKGQDLTPKEENWLEQIWKDLDNLNVLLHSENTKTEYKSSGCHYDENGIRILEKWETADSCNIYSKSSGKDTWRLYFQSQNSTYAIGVNEETYKKNNKKIQDAKSPFVGYIDVLRNRTEDYLNKPDRGNQGVFIVCDNTNKYIAPFNILISKQLDNMPDEFFWEAISDIPYNDKTLHEIMAGFDNVPSRTWDIFRPYTNNAITDKKKIPELKHYDRLIKNEKINKTDINDHIKTKSSPDDKTIDEKKVQKFTFDNLWQNSEVKSIPIDKITIEDTTGNIIEDLIEIEDEDKRKEYETKIKIEKEKLPDMQKQVIMIRFDEDEDEVVTFVEIGKRLNIDPSTAREHCNVAIKKFRKSLNTPK